jgi:hypothetical protein
VGRLKGVKCGKLEASAAQAMEKELNRSALVLSTYHLRRESLY